MYLNRKNLFSLIKGQQVPIPVKKVPQPAIQVEEEDLPPREIFLEIIKKFNKKPKKGEGDNIAKRKKTAIKELTEFFTENFPLIDEKDEDIFD